MAEQGLENLLRSNEKDLVRIRRRLFPAVVERVITGYNIYRGSSEYEEGKIYVNYLHAHLGHILTLAGMMQQEFRGEIGDVTEERLKERCATYVTDPSWDTQLGIRYFDESCVERHRRDVLGKELAIVIGETVQSDWLLECESERDLIRVIKFLKRYASKGILDKKGRLIKRGSENFEKNRFAVTDSWEVPFITIKRSDKKVLNLPDFSLVKELIMADVVGTKPVIISALCNEERIREMEERFSGQIVDIREKYLINEGYSWMR